MPSTAIIRIDLQVEGGQKLALNVTNLKELKAAIQQINAQKITLDPRSPQFAAASNQLKTLQGLYKGLATGANDAETQIKEANAALNQPTKAVGYYRQLQGELVKLTNQFKDLSQAEAQGKVGQNLSKQIGGISDTLKAQDAQLGNFQRNVGNYKQGLLGVGDLITGGLATGGIVAAIGAVAKVMQIGEEQAIKYEKSLDDLSALTGLKGEALSSLETLGKSLRTIQVNGVEIVNTGPDILEAMKLVGGARPELLQSAEALADVTKQAIVLSAASGDTLANSVAALTTELGQFNEPASEAKRLINELAAGAKVGAAEIPQITDSLKEFGTVAKISNVTTGESIALIETLAARQLKGAEAGTQLRNIFAKLAAADILPPAAQAQFAKLGIDINVLRDSTLPLQTRLNELGKAQGDLSALTKIFGLENLQAATIITSNLPQYAELKKGIEGTSDAYDQAAIRSENLSTKLANLKNGALNKLNDGFSTGNLVVGGLIDGFDFLINKSHLLEEIFLGPLVGGFDTFIAQSKSFLELIGLKDKSPTDVGAFFDISGVKDSTEKLLQEAAVLKEVGDTADGTKKSITELKREIKQLTISLGSQTPGSLQFKEIAAQLKAAKKELKSAQLEAGILGGKSGVKEKDLGAADSIARITKEVTRLQDALSKAPQSQIPKLTKELILAEQALARAKSIEQSTRNPTPNLSEVQQAEAGLLSLQIDTPENKAAAKAQLDNLAQSLAGSVGVTIPVDIDQEQAKKDFEIQKNFLDQEDKIKADNAAKELDRKEKQKQQTEEFSQVGIQAASQFNSQLAAQQTARVDKQLQDTTAAITEEFDAKRTAAQGNAQIIANLDKQQKAAQKAAEKQAAKERKAIAIKEAIIAGAIALISASGKGPAAIVGAIAATALGLAAIAAQEFFAGGTVQNEEGVVKSANMKPTKRGDNRVAYLKVGERVLTRDNQASIEEQYGANIWRNIGAKDPNSIFGQRHGTMIAPTFAAGRGILNVNTSLSREDIGQLSKAIAQTNDRMGGVVKSAMVEGAKYAERERKAKLTH